MDRLLDTFDEWARAQPRRDADARRRPSASSRRACRRRRALSSISRSGEIASIVWATGFRPDYRWLDVPVWIARASCGTTAASSRRPGCTRIGLPVLRRRKSTFIHGAEDDARDLVDHLAGYLSASASPGRGAAGLRSSS